ncbi:carboxypeptidase regulatory-like domain-containing protein [Oleiharenicola lentus]|uniref:carboxypeptidase regulatory-like domain-containing protein n=1 Tax=Oleiharenicola lentus TaxID=2508720 RepID=UPI003F66F510
MRIIALLLTRAWLGLALTWPILALARPVEFNLPAQSAADALLQFSQQTKAEVLFPFDALQSARSTEVVGTFEPADALSQLLHNTGFSARRKLSGKFVVTRNIQATSGISGKCLATSGTPIAGLTIMLSNRERTVTGEHGEFAFAALLPGSYRLVASGLGYRTTALPRITLDEDQQLTLPAQTIEREGELVQLDPYIVGGKDGRANPLDRSGSSPRIATGNLDLPRTDNDAIPYTILDRTQLLRSGVVNLNEFLQREILDANSSALPPDQNGTAESYFTGSSNLNLRGFADSTIILVNGRRLPEVLTSYSGPQQADVNLIPLGLVQQVEVLSASGSALYSGSPVGGVINIVLRQDIDSTEVTTTYSNALGGLDAPQSSISLQHGQTLLDKKIRLRFSATFTETTPPVESELGYRLARTEAPVPLANPIYRATPNVRSVDGGPLFGLGSSSVTSVAPNANGTGGLAAFAGRAGLRNFDLFDSPGGMAASLNSSDFPYGRWQEREAYYGSLTYDVLPWLQVGLDGFHARTRVARGYDVITGDLTLAATSPLNPFGRAIAVSLNELAPLLGENYSQARLESSSAVLGLIVKLPHDWRVTLDAQYGRNVTKYRGLAGVDTARWQQLVDTGSYNPLRDTQVFTPPQEFYDRVLIYRGTYQRFDTLGDYQTLDGALRVTNQQLNLPTGLGSINGGIDYRRNHLAPFTAETRFADGTLALPSTSWDGRTLERISVFGELQAAVLPEKILPRWLDRLDTTLAARYVAADTSNETNLAPALGLKADFEGGFSLRGSVTFSSRFPTPNLSRQSATGGGPGGGLNLVEIFDPRRNESYNVQADEPPNAGLSTEDTITQTAGIVFQHGKVHRFRISLDFTDTEKTNELVNLEPQPLVNLETLFPERIARNAAQPGDPGNAGKITSLLTGVVNAASRHSQNWSSSLDYRWTEFMGGTLELRSRYFAFQKYDLKLFSSTPAVDELSAPDGAAPGLLRHRLNFGAGWFNRTYGFGLDGHYYHSRILPLIERPSQGDKQIKPYTQFDAYIQAELSHWLPEKSRLGLRAQVRINNILNTEFPRYVNDASGAGVQPYGDFRGRTLSVSLTAQF